MVPNPNVNHGRQSSRRPPRLSRRRFIAAASGGGVVALAGCSSVVDWLSGFVMEEVNIFNLTDETQAGTIVVRDPEGETVLEESVEIRPESDDDDTVSDDDDSVAEGIAVYDDVWTEPGLYEVEVELTAPLRGESDAMWSHDIDTPDDERVAVFLVDESDEDPLQSEVGEGLTDFDILADES